MKRSISIPKYKRGGGRFMITLNGENLTLNEYERVAFQREHIKIAPEAYEKMRASRKVVESNIREEKKIYGITTGFGALSNVRINTRQALLLQKNLLLSHAAGVGSPLSPEIVRGMLLLRINSLTKGYSGIRSNVVDRLVYFLNEDLVPYVPSQGSVGASGDLAPLAHLALPLIGYSKLLYKGNWQDTEVILKEKKISPIELQGKEGLALINGTQAMTSILAGILIKFVNIFKTALLTSIISLEALKGTDTAFDEKIQAVRPYTGQIKVAESLRKIIKGSEIRLSHKYDDPRIQDAYTLRAIPQVYGAVYDVFEFVKKQVEIEMNSATDNPLIFANVNECLSGGNFHGEPMALAADMFAIAISSMGNMIERRIDRLVNPLVSGLPPFLTGGDVGLNSGYMLWQYTAASLASENKVLSHPASVDSIPTSAYKEDHVSMGTIAARKADIILENIAKMVTIELMCGTQGLEFHRPLKSSKTVENAVKKVRNIIPGLKNDRYCGDDFRRLLQAVEQGNFSTFVTIEF